jgi:FAD:protein FMN transferase
LGLERRREGIKNKNPMMALIRARLLAPVLLIVAALPGRAAPRAALTRFEYAEPHMGTTFRIVLYARDKATADRAARRAFDRIEELNLIMSDYLATSELSRLSRSSGGLPVKVSADLFRVLAVSQDIARRSDGAFDITVGPLVQLWRRARRRHELPESQSLANALRRVGYQNLVLDSRFRTAHLIKPGMELDLGAVGKGFADDEALKVLARFGILRALVAGGGDIAVGDPPPGKSGWMVAIEPLDPSPNATARMALLRRAAISTSGDSEQHVEIAGVRYSHVVDPRSGLALTGHRSVTVVARRGILSDGLATAASVLGPDKGLELIRGYSGAGLLYFENSSSGAVTRQFHFPTFIHIESAAGKPISAP